MQAGTCRRALTGRMGDCARNIRESLINSVYCANGIFFRPAASENLVHSAAISAVSFLAGQKNPLFYRNHLI